MDWDEDKHNLDQADAKSVEHFLDASNVGCVCQVSGCLHYLDHEIEDWSLLGLTYTGPLPSPSWTAKPSCQWSAYIVHGYSLRGSALHAAH